MNGIINLNKPKGPTSCRVVNDLKHMLNVKKIGHIGTLDPEVTGLLPLCVGKATKIVELLSNFEKIYVGVMKLGIKTDTQDASGKVLSKCFNTNVSDEELKNVLDDFEGEIDQKPPMFSAAKYKGQRLYQLARRGLRIDVAPKKVHIYSLELLERKDELIRLKIKCSKGTYIRTLFNDIGDRLGCGAHMVELERTGAGGFDIADSVTLSRIKELKEANRLGDAIIPIDNVLEFMPVIYVEEGEEKAVLNGKTIWKDSIKNISKDFMPEDTVLIKNHNGELLALGKAVVSKKEISGLDGGDSILKPKKILV